MKTSQVRRVVIAAWVALFVVALRPSAAKAGYPDPCVGTAEITEPNVVGRADVGYMLGFEATVPKQFLVFGFSGVPGEYTRREYWDGLGLIPPSEHSPLWLARVDGPGTYLLLIDGEECVVTVGASVAPDPDPSPLPSSVPVVQPAGSDTAQSSWGFALLGYGVAGVIAIAGYAGGRQRTG